MDKPIIFSVASGFGARSRQSFVQVAIEAANFTTQMSPAEARDLAINLLCCADAAESDAFLVGFLRARVGSEDEAIAGVLQDFREWREGQRK